MGEKNLGKNIENKTNQDRNLVIYFKICEFNHLAISPSILIFKSSNYELSRDEIMRASLRPSNLALDNKVVYVKSNEKAYLNEDEENILKVNYCKLDHKY